jgi:type III secretion protein K
MSLHRLVCEFNLRPDSYVDRSWLPGDWPEIYCDQGRFGARARALLARQILATAGLAQQFDFDFAAPEKRVALIAPEALRRLAEYCGLCIHKELLRERGAGRILDAVVGAFGRDAVQFVMERTPYLRAVRAKGALLKEHPEIAENKIRERGYRLLLSFLSGSGAAVFGRFRLKLPKKVAELTLPALEVEQAQQVTELMLLCIIPERLGEWDWLF